VDVIVASNPLRERLIDEFPHQAFLWVASATWMQRFALGPSPGNIGDLFVAPSVAALCVVPAEAAATVVGDKGFYFFFEVVAVAGWVEAEVVS
jgi:hypothetical protein